jgi:hypothetical protein
LMRAKNSFEASDNFNNARIKPFDESTNWIIAVELLFKKNSIIKSTELQIKYCEQ